MPKHQLQTQGGTNTFVVYSGSVALGDQMIYSGRGLLGSVTLHQAITALSGVGLTFYDAALTISGGPIPASGHTLLANPLTAQGASGLMMSAGTPTLYGVPFSSGLAVNCKSGQPGFTVTYTPY